MFHLKCVCIYPALSETLNYGRDDVLWKERQLVVRPMRTKSDDVLEALGRREFQKGMCDAVENSGKGLRWLAHQDVMPSSATQRGMSAFCCAHMCASSQPALIEQHRGIDKILSWCVKFYLKYKWRHMMRMRKMHSWLSDKWLLEHSFGHVLILMIET